MPGKLDRTEPMLPDRKCEVVVLNAGTHPEPIHIARALDELGRNVSYLTASYLSNERPLRMLIKFMGLFHRVQVQLERRISPFQLRNGQIVSIASWEELIFQLSIRLLPAQARRVLTWRTKEFASKAAKRLNDEWNGRLVVGQSTSAHDVFNQVEQHVVRVLNYPIAHHHWMRKRLQREAEHNPDWADYLQGHDRSIEEVSRMDKEIELATLILVPSSFVKQTFVDEGVTADKVSVVHLGADREVFTRGTSVAPRSGREHGLDLLFVGQVNQRKGISYLLEVMGKEEHAKHTLTIIGNAHPEISRIISKMPNVVHLSTMPKKRLGEFYASADALVLPSFAEGFPLVAIEAMSMGTPCIISHETFAKDVISDGVNGLLVEAGSTESLNQAIKRIASDSKLLESMSCNARETAKLFTWERYRTGVVEAIREKYSDI